MCQQEPRMSSVYDDWYSQDMKTPKFLAHIIDKNGVLTKRHKNVSSTPANARSLPQPNKGFKKLRDIEKPPVEPYTDIAAQKHVIASSQVPEKRFFGLKVSEAARINSLLLANNYMLDQWADIQDELIEAHYPLRSEKWSANENPFPGDEPANKAYRSFAEMMDTRYPGDPRYPDMSEREKEIIAFAFALPKFGGKIGNMSISPVR